MCPNAFTSMYTFPEQRDFLMLILKFVMAEFLLLLVYVFVFRKWFAGWGATRDERDHEYAGRRHGKKSFYKHDPCHYHPCDSGIRVSLV